MRVSPALLAAFSLVAIAGLPSLAAESSETANSPILAESTVAEPTLAEPISAESVNPDKVETTQSQTKIAQLLSGISSADRPNLQADLPTPLAAANPLETAAPANAAQAQPAQIEPQADLAQTTPGNPPPSTGNAPDISPPSSQPAPGTPPGAVPAQPAAPETQVLVSEVDVVSTNPQRPLSDELVNAVYQAVSTVPGRTTTRTQLQQDINSVFGTGFFSNVRANPEDTPLGVKVTFFVEPNPVLTRVNVRNDVTGGSNEPTPLVLPPDVIDRIFSPQYGKILNLRDFQDSVLDLNDWYQENGYVLAQVTAAPQIGADGTVTLIVAEGEIESIQVRYITSDGETTDEDGNPITGRTRDFIVTREFETKPGDVFQESAIQQDLGRAFGLGIFDDIRISLDPGDEDPRKVKLIVNVAERNTGSVGASVGFNLRGDLFGQLSYSQDNLGGNNQKLRTEAQITTRGDFLFDASFTDPWIAGDPYRTSYTANLFNRRATSLIFDNGPIDVNLPSGDTPRVNRLGTGISFSRPLDNGLSLSLGAQYQRVAILDAGGSVSPVDALGNQLAASSSGRDDLFTVQFGAALDRRNSPVQPTSGSLLRLSTEQSLPVGSGSVFYNKIQGSYSRYIPLNVFNSSRGGETLAFNLQGGTTLGNLPPYEAFPLGGGNSVRGYEEGAVGSGRSFLLGTAEYRFPLFSEFLTGAVFADYGTDLGSGDAVRGNPAGVRGKPGNGFGYGAGVRVQTPLGALRLDYGFSDAGSRFHFGFGERF